MSSRFTLNGPVSLANMIIRFTKNPGFTGSESLAMVDATVHNSFITITSTAASQMELF